MHQKQVSGIFSRILFLEIFASNLAFCARFWFFVPEFGFLEPGLGLKGLEEVLKLKVKEISPEIRKTRILKKPA